MIRHSTLLLALAGLILLVSPAALADIVFLEGGGRVEGVVTDLGKKVKVQGLNGSVTVLKSKIADHMKTPFVTEIYADKFGRIDSDSADDHYRLAMWCRRNMLKKRAAAHLSRALELDPDHEDTRATLGHVNFKGVWLSSGEALEASMAERGFLRFQGRWYTEAGLLAYLDARREEQKIEAEAERRRAEREALARQAREEEEKLKLLQAERKAVEDALAAAEQTRRERDELLRQNRDLIDLMRDRSWDYGRYGYGAWMYYGAGCYGGAGIYGAGYGVRYVRRRVCRPLAHPLPISGAIGFRQARGNVHIRGVFR